MDPLTREAVVKRYRKAKERRHAWEAHWQECYDFALPQRGGFVGPTRPGEKKTDRLFDGTAADAVDQLAASLLAQLTPPWSRWFGLAAGSDVAPEERGALAPALERTAAIVQSHFDRSGFAVEMLLRPVNIIESRLDPDRLRIYQGELTYREANGEAFLELQGRRLVSASCCWDPAYGAPGEGDNSVIAAVFTDAEGSYWLHGVRYLNHDPSRLGEADEATQMCRQVAEFARALYLPAVKLETNGLGKFLPGRLRQEMAAAAVPCAVIEAATTRPKDQRILEAFDAVLAAGALHAHIGVWDTPFIQEMREWRPGATAGRGRALDDGLDAVSGCLLSEPVRLRRYPLPVRRDWRPGGGVLAAETDFQP